MAYKEFHTSAIASSLIARHATTSSSACGNYDVAPRLKKLLLSRSSNRSIVIYTFLNKIGTNESMRRLLHPREICVPFLRQV